MKSKASWKKVSKIAINVLIWMFLAIAVLSVIVTVVASRNDGAVEVFGYQMRIVLSDSMAESEQTDVSDYEIGSFPVNSMVFIQSVPKDRAEADRWYGELKVGDVLTFKYLYASHVTITHRITSITPKKTGGYVIELAGDNKGADADVLYQTVDTSETDGVNYVIGKVVAVNYPLGAAMSLIQKPLSIALIIILPCFIIILFEVVRIVQTLNKDKRIKEQEDKRKKEDEIEELKRKLAALEKANGSDESDGPSLSEEKIL